MDQVVIGIDAGGTWIKAGVVDVSGEIIADVKTPSGAASGQAAYRESIQAAVKLLEDKYGGEVGADIPIGLSVPALMTRDRRGVLGMANVRGLERLDTSMSLEELLGSELGGRVKAAENDAAAAAVAEWTRAGADSETRLLLVTWGTGIGTALVAEGKIQYGWEGGHIPIYGSVENNLESMTAVPRLVRKVMGRMQKEYIGGEEILETAEEILRAAEDGEAICREEVVKAAEVLAWGLQVWAVIGCPDEVVLGGAFVANDWIVNEVKEAVRRSVYGYAEMILPVEKIRAASLGNRAGVIGAAYLARQAWK